MTATVKTRNWALSCGVSPGLSRFSPDVGRHRPVVVLARSVDAGERLFVKQADQAVFVGGLSHYFHRQVLVVGAEIGVLKDRGEFVLAGGDFVVAGLHRHAELEELGFHIGHVGKNALGNRSEILVFHFLPLGRLGAEERSSGVDQVGAKEKEVLVDQEVFLLRPDSRKDVTHVLAEELEDADRLRGEGFHRAQQGGLLVEGFAGPTQEGGGDYERRAVGMFNDIRGAGRVPCGIAASFECRPQSAGREAAGIGLALDQLFSAEIGDRAGPIAGSEEAVMLLGGKPGHGLELVGVMRGALLHRPVLNRGGDGIGDRRIQRRAMFNRFLNRLEDRFGQPGSLHLFIENIDAEEVLDMDFLEINVIELVFGTGDRFDRLLASGGHVGLLEKCGWSNHAGLANLQAAVVAGRIFYESRMSVKELHHVDHIDFDYQKMAVR